MASTGKRLASICFGLLSIGAVLVLLWSAVCLAHSESQALLAHSVMGVITALIVVPVLYACLFAGRSERGSTRS